jgi:hypothetical protein
MKLIYQSVIDAFRKDDSDPSVMQHNFLTRAAHDLSASEHRVLFIAMAKVKSYSHTERNGPLAVTVTSSDIEMMCGVKNDYANEILNEARTNLKSRWIKFLPEDMEKGDQWTDRAGTVRQNPLFRGITKSPTSKVTIESAWVTGFINERDETISADGKTILCHGSLTIVFSDVVSNLITNLADDKFFTTCKLKSILKLNTRSAIKLFLFISRKRQLGICDIKISDLSHGEADSYQNFSDLRKHFIEPGIKVINKKLGINLSMLPTNGKRGVKFVTFRYDREMPRQVEKVVVNEAKFEGVATSKKVAKRKRSLKEKLSIIRNLLEESEREVESNISDNIDFSPEEINRIRNDVKELYELYEGNQQVKKIEQRINARFERFGAH